MTYRFFSFSFILISLIGIFSTSTFILMYNPYIVHQKNNLYIQEPNQNYLKTEYIIRHPNKYDSFIFGSSRVGKINPKLFTNGNYYNMTYSEGLPYEHLLNIKLFLKNNVKIKNIIIGIDDFSYEIDPKSHFTDTMRKPHYLASGESFLNFYNFYRKIKISSAFNVYKQIGNSQYYDINNTGMPIVPLEIEKAIESNSDRHALSEKFKSPCHYKGNRVKETFDEIQEIVNLCKEHNIHLSLFINPIHHITYLDTDFENFSIFKKKLASIYPYYDFSGLNNITTNNYYWYETSHYRTKVGDMIAKRLNNTSNHFGTYVTLQNINDHLIKLEKEKMDRKSY